MYGKGSFPSTWRIYEEEHRVIIKLASSELDCRHFYVTTNNKKNNPERLMLRKYCPGCNIHAPFKETKI
jgi:large subunit ribosomal protein L33